MTKTDFRKLWRGLCLFVGLAPCAFAQSADQQPKLVLVDSAFSETFTVEGTRNLRGLSSRTIVGLHIGHGKGPFKISDITAPVGIDKGAEYCIKLSSSDARYRSLNRYRASRDAGPSELIETHSKFESDLAKTYVSDDVAIKLALSKQCQDDDDKVLIPVAPPGADKSAALVVLINARGSRANVSILDDSSKSIAAAACSPANADKAITYTDICEFPSIELGARQRVKLKVDILGEASEIVDIKLGLR